MCVCRERERERLGEGVGRGVRRLGGLGCPLQMSLPIAFMARSLNEH